MRLTRRQFAALSAAGAAALAFPFAPALAQDAKPDVKLEDLLKEGAAKDYWQGSKDAPATIVEYASMTCGHCAHFHETTYPTLKSKYIDTGKVRFTMRDFPLDPLAAAASMLARCGGDDKRDALVSLLFSKQSEWVVQKPIAALQNLVKQAGFTQESFESCLKNQELYDALTKGRDAASDAFGINSTPTFFINGKRQVGAITVDELDKLLAPYLKN
ncbi:MAG: DsbA family protein [Rhizobiales bacterium]|nr:DsbA family protein [Hyphomicrobiales bacterium]